MNERRMESTEGRTVILLSYETIKNMYRLEKDEMGGIYL
jgi:hypothetical protein